MYACKLLTLPLNPVGDHEKWRWASRWMICGNSVEKGNLAPWRDAPLTDFGALLTVCLRAVHYAVPIVDVGPSAARVRSSMLTIAPLAAISRRLSVAVIDNRRPMLSLMRGMLAAIGTGRIETYEARSMPSTPWQDRSRTLSSPPPSMQPLTGRRSSEVMRHSSLRRARVRARHDHERPTRKPGARRGVRSGQGRIRCWCCRPPPARSIAGIDWLINDDRPFELKGEHYVVAGIEERLSLSMQRPVYVPEERGLPLSPRPTRIPLRPFDIASAKARVGTR